MYTCYISTPIPTVALPTLHASHVIHLYITVLCYAHAYVCVCIVRTSLHHTAIHLSAASHLLVTYVFAHLVQDGLKAMHSAVQGGHWEVIKFLSSTFGARIHDGDNSNVTMLHWAAYFGHCQVARCLIEEFGMDPQDREKVCGR